ncbi:RNA polymerase sigma factor [Massilia sp. erpn]|uniref:RNA polymerase sigma factor n=1 Tax=Massilia sp. erpn TaxID=2738142 RepID=UPI002104D873|nr:RNA polymerase sigma factor [Massilia sp. erpn]UTY59694.1 RNA polymerase sigma factor [Massilia sp. erpn]
MHISNAEISTVTETLQLHELEQLVRAQGRRLHNFIRRRVGSVEDADDLAQETLLEAMRCRDKFQYQSRPETWLFGIALNLIRNHYRRNRVRDIFDDIEVCELVDEAGRGPADLVESHQIMQRVSDVLARLSDDTRAVVHLVFDEQLSYAEAAHELAIPIGTVRSRISRARAQLKLEQLA